MKTQSVARTLIILLIVLSNISCDRISKNIARKTIEPDEHIEVISHYFTLTRVENSGAFLSLGSSLPGPVRSVLLLILPLVALGYACLFLMTKKDIPKTMLTGLCFLIGGGAGNIYDRIVYGSVTDFMHMDFGVFRTGIFNMADVSIMIGIGLMLLQSFQKKSTLSTTD